ncbi:MAG: winged helix-turn-helix transcriptional regulator [Chloroflexi bacterium]|nr:winged helix-turn-helix transcriptional regulator [Chloroflexota bacterium]
MAEDRMPDYRASEKGFPEDTILQGSNPFRVGAPIREPKDFFGRKLQLQRIFEAIQKQQNVSLIGEARSGNTSLMLMVQHQEIRRKFHMDDASNIFVYITAEVLDSSPGDFFHELFSKISLALPDFPGANLPEKPDFAEVRDLLRSLRRYRLIILLDEFEYLASEWSVTELGFLRGMCMQAGLQIVLITATRNPLHEIVPMDRMLSAFFNIFQPVRVGAFMPEEFNEFLGTMGRVTRLPLLVYEQDILELAGRFPFFVQLACSELFEATRANQGNIPSDWYRLVRARFAIGARGHFQYIWDHELNIAEHRALVDLLVNISPSDAIRQELEDKGYLAHGRIFSSAFRDYVEEITRKGSAAVPLNDPGPSSTSPQLDNNRRNLPLVMEEKTRKVWVCGTEVGTNITENEFSLLSLLSESPGATCNWQMISKAVWGDEYLTPDKGRIHKMVSRLQEKLKSYANFELIISIRGVGYKLVDSSPPEKT